MDQKLLFGRSDGVIILNEPDDCATPLIGVIEAFQRGIWKTPLHQRVFVWEKEKIQAWIDRLVLATQQRHKKPVGAIVTYQINDGLPSPVFVNDGCQRINACIAVRENPQAYGYTKEIIEDVFAAIHVLVQHRWYKNHNEAVSDFRLLNIGTTLTPREMCKGILSTHPNYEFLWVKQFQRVHTAMDRACAGLVKPVSENDRRLLHKYERHDFALIDRWLAKDSRLTDYPSIATAELKLHHLTSPRLIEQLLLTACEVLSPEELEHEISLLINHINRTKALCLDLWHKVEPDGVPIKMTLFRWIVFISIWARQVQLPNTVWEDFLFKLFRNTRGSSYVQDPNDPRLRVTLSLANGTRLYQTCDILGAPIDQTYLRRRRVGKQLLPGFDDSHVNPFVTHGNGPTVPEPASRNRARGAKPIEGENT